MSTGDARWRDIESVFHAALSRDPAARGAFLDGACADAAARAEVEAMLAAHERRGPLDALLEELLEPGAGGVGSGSAPGPASGAVPGDASAAAPVAPGQSLPGHPRYRIVEKLGGGGMGVVYRARDERLGRDVALKFLHPMLGTDHEAKRRFLVEARAAAAIEHPNICTVHEIGDTADGQLYIVMACYEGETLDHRIARGPLALGEALRVVAGIARGLQRAHERGIVHRDIKPANVMCTADGQVKLLDFGVAKLADVSVTQTTGAVGTIAYMSPEQAFGETVDACADLWALGVVLYEMLAGVRPFTGSGAQGVLLALATREPDPLALHRPGLPPGVEALVRRLLSRRPEDRVPSAASLLDAIAALEGALGDHPADRAPRDSALARAGERRQVVVACLRFDADRRTAAGDAAESVARRVVAAARTIAARHGGLVQAAEADRVILLFGVPAASEDDPRRAVRAVLELHDAVAEPDGRVPAVELRSGVHVGAAVVQGAREAGVRYEVSGAPMDVAAALAAVAEPDAVLLSAELRRLVADTVATAPAGDVPLADASDPVAAHRVQGMTRARPRLEAGAALSPFVGRERERTALQAALDAALSGAGRVAVLMAEAGAGKSRLLLELREAAVAAEAHVVQGRCDPHGASTPMLPFVEAVQELLAVPRSGSMAERHQALAAAVRATDPVLEDALPLVGALLGVTSAAHPVPDELRGEDFQAALRDAVAAVFTLAAQRRPVVLLLEDWHWADEASRAALRQLAELVSAVPCLLVVTARPEAARDWGTGEHHVLLSLPPLDGTAAEAIACALLEAQAVAPPLLARLHEGTGGNPFFLEELCAALREAGVVAVRGGEAVLAAGDGELPIPGTVQGVLRTRMDRLDVESRDTLRVAAVIGREFTRGILARIVEHADGLPLSLERLKASGLVQQVGVVPEPSFRFKHALTQDVAYDSLLEGQRRVLHAAVGRAIEARHATQLEKHVERLAHHFGLAGEWEPAVRYALRAAERAMALGQGTEAGATLERAREWVARLPDGAVRRDLEADTLLLQERLHETLGLRARQLELVEALIDRLSPHGPSTRLAQAYLRLGDVSTLLGRYEAAERALATARALAAELGDAGGERNARRSLALLRSHEGRHADALAEMEQVVALGREAGDTRAEAGDAASMANMLRALGQHARARDVLLETLSRVTPHHNQQRYGYILNVLATVHRDLGEVALAMERFRESQQYMTPGTYASFTLPGVASIQLEQGDVEGALATYREAVAIGRRARYADGTAHVSRSLGDVLLGLGRHDEALPHLHEAAELFAQLGDTANELLMRRRIAGTHERRGAWMEAEAAWVRVLSRARTHGDPASEAEALEAQGRTARRLGMPPATVLARHEAALAAAERGGDRARELAVRNALGIVCWEQGRHADAVRHYEAALRLCRTLGDRVHEGLILNSLGASLHRLRRLDEARLMLQEGARVAEAAGEPMLQAQALGVLGEVCLDGGRLDEARRAVETSLTMRRELQDVRGEGWMHERLARIARAAGDRTRAADHVAAGLALLDRVSDPALGPALAAIVALADTETHPTTLPSTA